MFVYGTKYSTVRIKHLLLLLLLLLLYNFIFYYWCLDLMINDNYHGVNVIRNSIVSV